MAFFKYFMKKIKIKKEKREWKKKRFQPKTKNPTYSLTFFKEFIIILTIDASSVYPIILLVNIQAYL
jgi:hypothetical protein